MSRPPGETARSVELTFSRLGKPAAEWLIWVLLGIVIYALTGVFDQKIPEYAFGTAGWPRALCIAVLIGATAQFGFQILVILRGRDKPAGDIVRQRAVERQDRPGGRKRVQRLCIFGLPLLYLYVMPSLGFYVVTPIFVVAFLLLLEVKAPVTLATVTCILYVILLLIFTRFFYVALPVGRIQFFYDLNNAIVVLVRTGL